MNIEINEYIKPSKKNLIVIYVLYALGIIVPLLPILGGIFAYLNQDTKGNFLQSHYKFAFRTFVLGLIGAVISIVTTIILIGPILYVFVFVWFIMRSIIAIQLLFDDKPHPNPLTFWIK